MGTAQTALVRQQAHEASLRVRYPTADELQSIQVMAKTFCKTEMARSMELTDEGLVTTLAMQGLELGLPFMASLRGIRLIKGKPQLAADLMRALATDRIGGAKVDWIKMGEEGTAECIARRPGHNPVRIQHTVDDAKRAGLMSKETYQKYPPSMLRAWCLRDACRLQYAELYYGLGVSEAIGVETEEGTEFIDTDGVEVPADHTTPNVAEYVVPPVPAAPAPAASAPAAAPPPQAPPDPGPAPEDRLLEFTTGPLAGKKLSDLHTGHLQTLYRSFVASVKKAEESGDSARVERGKGWLVAVQQWGTYRGVDVTAPPPAAGAST